MKAKANANATTFVSVVGIVGLLLAASLACDRKGVGAGGGSNAGWSGDPVGTRQVGPHTMSPTDWNTPFGRRSALVALPASTQFDVTGFLQEASVSGPGPTAGGQLKVNGHVITVPDNTTVILPANALTWQELFAQAPPPYGPTQSGLAMADVPSPLTTWEAHVIGNRVPGAAGGDQYIAGLIYVSQQGVNAAAGFINFIDYAAGEMRVGGLPNDPTTGARVRINDPVVGDSGTGRFSKGLSPDRRFTVDQDNPTIISATGYPMCLPRAAPPAAGGAETDPQCPQGNRPVDAAGNALINITMPDPATLAPRQLPDPRIQAPFMVGDYISFSGTLVGDNDHPTAGPWPGSAGTYISAHTITNNTAIYTAPGTNPAYVMTEVTILGTGGLTVAGAAEAAIRTRFEGMTTDPSRGIHLYGIDLDPATGATSDRDFGTIGIDPGPPAGAVKGRWRFRPPCDPFGTVPARPDQTCVMNQLGTFLPATREVRAVVEGLHGQVPGAPTATTVANGIFFGQYHAPILEYIFPENVPGTPIVPNNFESIPFLACGGYSSSAGTLAGPLTPWPGSVAPVCANTVTPPTANAGPAAAVASGTLVTLAGSATGTTPITFHWTQTAGPTVALSSADMSNPTFTAPIVATPTALTFALTATNAAGSSIASVTVTVSAAAAPTVNHIAARTVGSSTPVTLTATCFDPAGLPCTFVWTQTSGSPIVLAPNPTTGASVTFTVAVPGGAAAVTLGFQIVATNSAGVSSVPDTTTVTFTPLADAVAVTSVEYRTGKQRLIITATSSIVSPTVDLTLAPYLTETGVTFDPAVLGSLFTNTGGGIYTLTLVGAPEPAVPPAAPITVRSTAGGVSPPHGIDRLRP